MAPDELPVVVMSTESALTAADDEIWWGAYLGTPDEILISGRVGDVTDEIVETRAAARARIGWIMDIYLLRAARQAPGDAPG